MPQMQNDEITTYFATLIATLGFEAMFEAKDFEPIFKNLSLRQLKKDELFLKPGSNSNTLSYIQKGIVRIFYIKPNGDEITHSLRKENDFTASYDVLLMARTNRFYYQALEPTTMVEINYDILYRFLLEKPQLELISKTFMLKMMGEFLERLEDFTLLNPEERYLKFIKTHTELNNRVPDKYIANILGITSVSLSRIRKRIASKS